MSFLDHVIAGTVPHLPRALVGRVARRYISGETLESALETTADFNRRGITTTLDVLGENIHRVDQADATVETYLQALREIDVRKLQGNISIKLTHLGLKLDRSRCFENVRRLVGEAARRDIFVRIDMEDSSTTTDTLDLYREIRESYENVGVVLQAYLRRSEADARELARMGARVRVCKGIYREPPDIAFQDRDEIRHSFLRLVEILVDHGSHVAVATHDDVLVEGSQKILAGAGGVEGLYEFQMLLGVTEALRDRVVAAGHPLRVYVPFGAEWYAYSLRRLRENPQIAGHVFRAFLRRG